MDVRGWSVWNGWVWMECMEWMGWMVFGFIAPFLLSIVSVSTERHSK